MQDAAPAFRIFVQASARGDFRRTRNYLRREAPHTVSTFEAAIARALRTVEQAPLRWQMVAPQMHMFLVPEVPYKIFYRIDDSTVFVLRIIHQRRHPDAWRRPP